MTTQPRFEIESIDQFPSFALDGNPDIITRTAFDENGNVVFRSVDNNADGIIDSIETFAYNSDGNLV